MLFIVCICIDIFNGKEFKVNLCNLGKYLVCGILSVGLYYGLTLLVHRVLGVGFAAYRGANQISIGTIIKKLPNSISSAYAAFKAYFTGERFLSNHIWHLEYLHTGLFVVTAILILYMTIKKKLYKNIGNIILIVLCVVCLPIAVNLIEILAPTTGITLLMAIPMGFVCPILLGINGQIIESMERQVIPWLCSIGIAVIIVFNYSFMDNASYQSRNWIYDKTYSMAARIYDRIELLYEESETDRVMIVGNINANKYFYSVNNSISNYSANEIPKGNLTWGSTYGDEKHLWNRIFNMMLGVAYNDDYTEAEYLEIVESEEFAQMGIFPDASAVQIIDDTIVVKVSETPLMP